MQTGLWSCLVPCGFYWCDSKEGLRMTESTMGANASSSSTTTDCPIGGGIGGGSIGGGYGGVGGTAAGSSAAATPSSAGIFIREQRRKKVTGFATLRKKFIRRRRSSKACDHGRVLREFVSDWSPIELASLLEEYEALAALKDLSVQAELARPPATTFKQDLSALYDFKHATDCDLVFRGTVFPVHRALLSARCPYFRDLLAGCPGFGARICLELRSSPVDVPLFSSLLRYLYTGDLCPHDPTIDVNLLRRLGDDFGTPNPLEHDLRYLLETGDYADAALVFTSEGSDYHRPDSGSSEYGFRPKLELPCHKAILSARSPFFRNLIQRRTRNGDGEHSERALHVPTRIVLDETVIPKRYARVLLHAIYLDTVDLTLILRGNGCGNSAGSLGEVQALTHTGRTRPTPLEEAMELYQIGRFLELDILAQGCEDLILEWLTLETLPQVLKWGNQPHGSAWVHRQACHFLREEFSAIVASPILHQLDKTQLMNALQSNFLQASELEVLQAVLKWGEHELIRRMEDREPNLLSHTAHSVTRKGIKKRDLSDIELREILSEFLPLVRMDHVLPPNSEHLNQAIRRGLVSSPPSHMIGDDRTNVRINAWVRCGKNHGLFVRPRLFMPYYEEIKTLLEDRIASQQMDMLRMRRSRHLPDIPDTLYMVSRLGTTGGVGNNGGGSGAAGLNSGLDIVAAALPAPDPSTMLSMTKREQKLRLSPSCQRALSLPLSSRPEINRQIRLRVVREFNLPDAVADLLENASCYCLDDNTNNTGGSTGNGLNVLSTSRQDDVIQQIDDETTPPPSPALPSDCGIQNIPSCYGRNMTVPRQQPLPLYGAHGVGGIRGRHELPALITERDGVFRLPGEPETSSCSDGHLSDIMPDVAMATASLGQLQLGGDPPESLQLDLGDGSSHMMGAAGIGVHGMQVCIFIIYS